MADFALLSRRRWMVLVTIALFSSGLLIILTRQGKPSVPVPSNLTGMEPQLRDYISEKVEWVRQKPRSAERQSTLGLVYIANALYPEAYLSFSNAAKLNPEEPLAQQYLAVAAEQNGDIAQAERLLRSVTNRFPKFAPAYCRLGEVSLKMGKTQAAEGAFQQLTEIAPREPRGYAGLAQVKLRQNDCQAALPLIQKALELEPTAKAPHYLLGLAYRGLGRLDEAKIELLLGANQTAYPIPDNWSTLIPEHIKLLQDQIDLARDLEEAGEADKAVAVLAKAYVYRTNDVSVVNNLAIALNRAGQPNKAVILLENALKENPRYLAGLITLSYSYHALGQHERALQAAESAVALTPQTAQAHIAKANAFLGMDRTEEALAALGNAFQCDPKNAEIQMQIGDILWRNRNAPEEALQHYLTATNLDPVLAPVYVRLADYYLYRGQPTAAGPVLAMLRRLAPTSPELALLEKRLRPERAQAH